jgi:selenocysteine lyase/cysteine desulfurase
MARLLDLTEEQVQRFHRDARDGSREHLPGAVRASAGRATTPDDVAALGEALRTIAATPEDGLRYGPDEHGDLVPREVARERAGV